MFECYKNKTEKNVTMAIMNVSVQHHLVSLDQFRNKKPHWPPKYSFHPLFDLVTQTQPN